ncbi:copper chaperone PCu(A)C [Aurantiacibacter sp. MUD61]|uniref:copper chaperone PCu(A)C n=1 Tax=Aurantiacibacter sp. MUD61 TaxID=3009083 RepID=UPI0022EFDFA2|nr:copper chaperone PCu(A)C [Aurantiacibacter sp. MUD61]
MMNHKRILPALTASLAVLSLAACGGETEEPATEVAESDCPPGVSVADGWLAMPAVAGNPAAAYFTISNTNEDAVTIRSAEMIGSESAMLHETAEWSMEEDMQELFTQRVEPGEDLEFAPGGKHVMIMGMSDGLEAGSESEITLTFVGGDKCSFPVTLYAAGTDPREEEEEA